MLRHCNRWEPETVKVRRGISGFVHKIDPKLTYGADWAIRLGITPTFTLRLTT